MYFKCVGEVNGKADVELFMSSARVEEGALVYWPLLLPWDHIFFRTA
jgi:hypothetical protein